MIRSEIDRDILCVEDRAGTAYVIEHIQQVDTTVIGPLTAHQWVRYRQDESGLYEADVDIGLPPACAPNQVASDPAVPEGMALVAAMRAAWKGSVEESSVGAALQVARRLRIVVLAAARAGRDGGPLAGEITRFRYPLSVGATWTVREAPLYTATVEASENLELPIDRVHAYRIRIDAPAILGPLDRMHFWYSCSGLLAMIVHIEIPTDLGTLLADENLVLEDLSIARGRF